MADDTNPEIRPMNFHCCDTPRGMLYYNMEDLTGVQQAKLNDLRIKTVRDDEQYLAGHPEIRACVALITRHVLQKRPRNNIHEVIAQFFSRSKIDIQEEIDAYIKQREGHVCEMDSAVGVYAKRSSSDESSFEDMSTLYSSRQETVSDSLKNVDINLDEVAQVPSGTVISSISEITEIGMIQAHETDHITKIATTCQIEDLIVSDLLNRIHYDDEDVQEHDDEEHLAVGSHPPISARVSFSVSVESDSKQRKSSLKSNEKAKVKEAVDKIIMDESEMVQKVESHTSRASRGSRPSIKFSEDIKLSPIQKETEE